MTLLLFSVDIKTWLYHVKLKQLLLYVNVYFVSVLQSIDYMNRPICIN